VEYSGCWMFRVLVKDHIANFTRALEANVVALVLTAYGHKNKKTPCLFRLDLFREPDTPHQVFEPRVRPQTVNHRIELQPGQLAIALLMSSLEPCKGTIVFA
jgi:hypothetical protein